MENTKIFAKSGKKIIHNVKWLVISLTLGLFLGGGLIVVNAWTNPTVAPPGGNIGAPLNISGIGQSKIGGLILNTGGAVNGLIVRMGNVGIGDSSPDGGLKLDVEGNAGAMAYCDQNGAKCKSIDNLGVPSGAVMAFNLNACPSGWHIFSNANGRAIFGMNGSDNSFDELRELGGEKDHILTINEMPSHSHKVERYAYSGGLRYVATPESSKSGSYVSTTPTGGNGAHNNLPPYVVLLYCVKD